MCNLIITDNVILFYFSVSPEQASGMRSLGRRMRFLTGNGICRWPDLWQGQEQWITGLVLNEHQGLENSMLKITDGE